MFWGAEDDRVQQGRIIEQLKNLSEGLQAIRDQVRDVDVKISSQVKEVDSKVSTLSQKVQETTVSQKEFAEFKVAVGETKQEVRILSTKYLMLAGALTLIGVLVPIALTLWNILKK